MAHGDGEGVQGDWSHCITSRKQREQAGNRFKLSNLRTHPKQPTSIKAVPARDSTTFKTAPQTGDQVFRHMSMWRMFHMMLLVRTGRVFLFSVGVQCCMGENTP